jgi:hypothetical protein
MSKSMKYGALVARLVFGAWFAFNGILYWTPWLPPAYNPVPVRLLEALTESGILRLVKIVELVVGLALLGNLYVPLFLVIGFPVSVIIAYNDLVLEYPIAFSMTGGAVHFAVHVFLLFAYLDYYKPLFTRKAYVGG